MRASSSRVVLLVLGPDFIHALQQRELVALLLIVHHRGRLQVEDGRVAAAELRALIDGGKKSGAPVIGPAQNIVIVGEHDVRGQILVRRAQAVRHPRAQRRPSRQNRSRVHLADGADVIQTVGPAGSDDRHLIHVLGDVLIPVGHPESALAVLFPGAPRGHQGIVAGAARGLRGLADRIGNRLAVEFRQQRLRIESVDVARAAFHE